MRYYLLIIPLLVGLMLSSCATIRFGRSTTVTIEAEHPGDIVDILAIGPKETVDLRNITLPFKYKVRHNNLPQRVDIISDNYIYEPFTIGAERKGELIAALSKIFGWGGGLGEMALVGGIGFATGSPDVGLAGIGAGVAIGAPLLAVAYTAETDIPDSKVYLTTSVPIDSVNLYQLQDWNLR
ncbi:MAG: hypothetical protein J1E63_06835, partial [Muribaculaceae bacterium]|nr:hypothetical protein [Muribaculaceae bacterium]